MLLAVVLLAVTAAALYLPLATGVFQRAMAKKDGDPALMVILVWLCGPIWAVVRLVEVRRNKDRDRRHRRALLNRSPWSVRVGPDGITTADN